MDLVPESGVTEEANEADQGTDVDKMDSANNVFKMDVESPSSEELEHLDSQTGSETESEADLNSQSYTIQKGDVTQRFKNEHRADSASPDSSFGSPSHSVRKNRTDDTENNENKEPVEKKPRKDKKIAELSTPEKRLSGDASKFMDLNLSGSRPGSAASSAKSGSGREKGEESKKLYMIWSGRVDPNKKEKEKEREERIKLAQQKIAEERQKKLEEMREQQRLAQENREKQLEARRRKIEEMKRREEERRRTVDERRRLQEETDRAKKEAILSKAKERLTRYEQWKSTGRKGGRRHVLGFGSRAPREVCLPLDRRSSSQSTLRRSPNSSDYDSYFHRRAVSASSVVRRHCCIDINKLTQGTGLPPGGSPPSKHLSVSTSVLYHKRSPDFSSTGALNTSGGISGMRSGAESLMASSGPPTRHKSSVNLGTTGQATVKMRERTSPRKPRPSSVATSMPSFVHVETGTPKSSRSRSTDRHARDRSTGKPSTPGRKDDKTDGQDEKHKSATLPRPYDRRKIEERRQEVKKKQEEKKDEDVKPPVRLTKSFIERMAAPKHPSPDKKDVTKEPIPVKVIVRKDLIVEAPKPSSPQARPLKKDRLKESPAKSALKTPKDKVTDKDTSSETRSDKSEGSEKSMSPAPMLDLEAQEKKADGAEKVEIPEKPGSPEPATEDTARDGELHVRIKEPEEKSPQKPKGEPRQLTPEPKVSFKEEVKTIPKTDKEREMEEYKAKLAEKRRLAREKAEREAEIERLRQEEAQRQAEERRRLEEERQRREEEEALRLAEEARKLEEERLQKAIEAEEKRRKEEAERLERERIEREEQEKRAKEEAERLEKERQERAKKEEEERLERKKRLEMIMKRVKTDTPTTTPEKRTDSPPRLILQSSASRGSLQGSSSHGSLVSSEDERGDDSGQEDKDKSDSDDVPKFKSSLLQKLTEQKAQSGDGGVPKFKSPLLQSLMGKTKIGARLSSSTTKLDETPKTDDTHEIKMTHSEVSLSTQDTEEKYQGEEKYKESDTNGHIIDGYDSAEDIEKKRDIDFTRGPDSQVVENSVIDREVTSDADKQITDSGVGEISPSSDTGVKDSAVDTQKSHVIVDATADSAVSLSYNGVASHNGDIHTEPKEGMETKELVDSSISMRTVDSFGSSQTDSFGGSFFDSQTLTTSQSDPSQFEEIIDLTVSNKNLKSQQLQERLMNHSEDLLNLNNIDNCMSNVDESSTIPGKPIIAFEDNAARRQDVPDLLS